MNYTVRSRALRASKIGVFAALYAVTSLIPISMFIGAPSFLALNLIITPTIAILLSPLEALGTSLFGGLIAFYAAPMQAMFGPYTILLPVAGATFGSLAYHKARLGALIGGLFLLTAISAYLIRNYLFPFFVLPHFLAFLLAIASSFKMLTSTKMKVQIHTFVSTMCEQGMMMIFAVHLLGIPWFVFPEILPLMVYERAIASIGAAFTVFTLTRIIPSLSKATQGTHGIQK